MIIKLYKSYGRLAHELKPIFSELMPATDHHDAIKAELPDALYAGTTEIGETLVNIDGEDYRLNELLINGKDDNPAIRWHDGKGTQIRVLKVVEQ